MGALLRPGNAGANTAADHVAVLDRALEQIPGHYIVLFAGTSDFSQQKFTAVNGHWYPIRDGVWMSFPEPFKRGMVAEITALDGDGNELFRLLPPPLEPGRLEPLLGPSRKTFAEWGPPGER